MKYTPIATWKNQYFQTSEVFKNLKYVPNFIWLDNVKEWIVVNHDKVNDVFATQLVLLDNGTLLYFYFNASNNNDYENADINYSKIKNSIQVGEYTTYITNNLPNKFSPRAILHNKKIILIAHNEAELSNLLRLINSKRSEEFLKNEYSRDSIGKCEDMVVNYFWSIKKYYKWNAKIALEFLSLFEGAGLVLDLAFKELKEQIFDKTKKDDKLNISNYEGRGLKVKRLTYPGWLGYVDVENGIIEFPIFQTVTKNCHKVFIYEIKGYLLVCFSIFNIEYSKIILAKNVSLNNIYYVEYNYILDELNCYVTSKEEKKIEMEQQEYNEDICFENSDFAYATFSSTQNLKEVFS